MWDLPPSLSSLPPTYLSPVIFSAAGRRGVSSGPNRASIHSLTCVREAEAAQSHGRCACKRALSHEALLVVTAQEGLLIILTQGRMCAFKQKGGVVARKDRDRSFLMSSFVRTYVFTVNSVWNALVSMVGREKGSCGPKCAFSGVTNCLRAHFGLAPSARLSLHD